MSEATDRDLEELVSAAEMGDDEYGCGCDAEPVREYVRLLEEAVALMRQLTGGKNLLEELDYFREQRRRAREEADRKAEEDRRWAEEQRKVEERRKAFRYQHGVDTSRGEVWRITATHRETGAVRVEQAQIPGDEENALRVWLGEDWRERYEATAERLDQPSQSAAPVSNTANS